eukprot:1066712-Amphidinium_carterae.1
MDLAGPFKRSQDGFSYALIMAFRLAWIESIQTTSVPFGTGRRVQRIQSDRGLEFCNAVLREWCWDKEIAPSTSLGYDPQQNGCAERC